MFEKLQPAPPDPILALAGMAQADTRPEKLDLGIGIYLDETGVSPVMAAVREAERRVLEQQVSKAYLPARGNAAFLERLGRRVFSEGLWSGHGDRIGALQSTGCVAALRLGAEILQRTGCSRIWISDPTWPIHAPIFSAAGLEAASYPYYSVGSAGVDWPEMLEALKGIAPGDAVLLHGCCHNPSGADLSVEQWGELSALLSAQQAIPFIDVAYAGLGSGWDADLAGMRSLIGQADEAIVAVSCSKSFGLYRERTGALYFVGVNGRDAEAALSNGLTAARTNYSMPPDHGAAAVAEILGDPQLEQEWSAELGRMRERISGLRQLLAVKAAEAGLDWSFVRDQQGMFSLLPLTPEQVVRLREDFGIYMPANGRVCIPALSVIGCEYLTRSCGMLEWIDTVGVS